MYTQRLHRRLFIEHVVCCLQTVGAATGGNVVGALAELLQRSIFFIKMYTIYCYTIAREGIVPLDIRASQLQAPLKPPYIAAIW